MDKVVIVVPVHKNEFNDYEKISLCQLFKVLSKYPICLAAPEGLDVSIEDVENSRFNIEFFPAEYFESTVDYSRLLLSKSFYARFENYEYMLIYQLDCFVFRDLLSDFCQMGYDYMGAPIHQDKGFWSEYHVGNGGLSLRKISKTIELLDNKEEVFKKHPYPDQLAKAEDVFFTYCGASAEYDYSVPEVDVANRFSLYVDSQEKKESIINNGLPFGIHYFPTYYYDFWRPFIQLFGYKLPETGAAGRDKRYLAMMNQWMILRSENKTMEGYLTARGYKNIAVYGMSVYGRHLIRELADSCICVKYVIDRSNDQEYLGVKTYKPSELPESVDVIINSVVWDHDAIVDSLRKFTDCPVISLENIVFESYWT